MNDLVFTIITAMDINGGIGLGNQLPWHMPAELQHFKSMTNGKVVIVGRTTYESLPPAALKGRRYVVLSRSGNCLRREEDTAASNVREAVLIAAIESADKKEVMIAGGKEIYQQFMDFADKAIVTVVNADTKADTFLPVGMFDEWPVKSAHSLTCDHSGLDAHVTYYQRPAEGRLTPCIGMCSCSLGDIKCRGCGRTDIQVSTWNTYPKAYKRLLCQESKHVT